jgi:hypothetical protein
MEPPCAFPNLERVLLRPVFQHFACPMNRVAERARVQLGSASDVILTIEEIAAIECHGHALSKCVKTQVAWAWAQPKVNSNLPSAEGSRAEAKRGKLRPDRLSRFDHPRDSGPDLHELQPEVNRACR